MILIVVGLLFSKAYGFLIAVIDYPTHPPHAVYCLDTLSRSAIRGQSSRFNLPVLGVRFMCRVDEKASGRGHMPLER